MKKLIKFFLIVLFVTGIHTIIMAQTEGLSKHAIFYKVLQVDHFTPASNDNADWFDDFTTGGEFGYSYNFTERLSLNIPLKLGIANYPIPPNDKSAPRFTGDKLFFSGDITGSFRFLKLKSRINPYIMAGVGAFNRDGDNWYAQIPVGGGINFRLAKNFYLNTQYELRFAPGDDNFDNNQLGIGIWMPFGGKEKEEPPVELPPADADGDGIADINDKCPQEPGMAEFEGCPDTDEDGIPDKDDDCPEVAGDAAFNGCPDTDGDGLADAKDKCPEVAGPIDNNGCPIQDTDGDGVPDAQDNCPDNAGPASLNGCPDSDGDGVVDKDDQCPNTAGLAALNGCPDKDNDGVTDAMDKCPDKAGPASNQGCPELKKEEKEVLKFAMQAIEFETGSTRLKSSSNQVLNQVADILKKYPEYNVRIDGYTDSVGSRASNQSLSEKRAKACYDYLASRGIPLSRMAYTGYGESNPIADNINKEGRQRNRRVEFNIYIR